MKNKVLKICSCFFAVLILFFCSGCSGRGVLKKVSKNLSSYGIDVKFDDETKTLSGKENVCFVNNTDVSLENVCFNFYPRAFREESSIKPYTEKNLAKVFPEGENFGDGTIESVKIENKSVPFLYANQSQTAFCIKFEKVLEPGKKVNIEIEFSVKLACCTHRIGFYNGSVLLGNFFPILAVYEKGDFVVSPYYSTGDPFYSDLANFSVKFSAPEKYALTSTGVVLKEESVENYKNYTLNAIAVRDFAVSLLENCRTVSKMVEKTQISYVGYQNDGDFDQNLQTAVKVFEFYNKTFGKYPYEVLNIVKAPFVHGGMEYPCFVIVSDSVSGSFDKAKVIAHEIAHQWWYGIVGNNQIEEAWLDEALAEYSSVLFFEAHSEYGAKYDELVSEAFSVYSLYADIVKATNKSIKTSMLLPVNEYSSEFEYSYMIYVKGVLMFDALRDIVGKNKLLLCFKKYFRQYMFKTSSTDCLIACFRKTSGRDVEGFFDSWLSGKTVIGTI